jgi:murein L,D-transpeptidase YcbB/YkuD
MLLRCPPFPGKFLAVLGLVLALCPLPGRADETLWWFSGGRPTPEASRAVAVLEAAADQGLDSRDYAAASLRTALAQAREAQPLAADRQARLDAALTTALHRYLADLQRGRVDPREIHAHFDLPRREAFDAQGLLREAVAENRVTQALREAEPRVPMYSALRHALASYRALSGHPAWSAPLTLPGRKLSAGEPYAGLAVLAQRLEALGDLPAGSVVPPRFEGAPEAALRAFQERHGLAADGVLGAATLQQLNVPPAARARQIELSLERLRWTPLLQGRRMVVVNVPEFVLRAYDVEGSQVRVRLTMKVIVGKALDTRTPLIDEAMRFIEFSPYWNVPPSIARKETIPKLRRDPAYFEQQGFEFVTASGRVVETLSAANLDAVLQGGWRIRQRPGPKNALGDIKFVFPNNQNIYLHHTPAPQLFGRERRDFSHGCIRLEAPVELAKFVLADSPEWTEERIREAMAKGESRTLALKHPVPVLIAYSTVIAKAGRVFFYPDLYGHDRLLDQALRARSAALAPLILPVSAPK